MSRLKRTNNYISTITTEYPEYLFGSSKYSYVIKDLITTGESTLTVLDGSSYTQLDILTGAPLSLINTNLYMSNEFGYTITNTGEESISLSSSSVCIYDSNDDYSAPQGNEVLGGLSTISAGSTLSLAYTVYKNGYEFITPTIFHEDEVDIILTNGYDSITRETLSSTNKVDIVSPLRNQYMDDRYWYEIKNNHATDDKIIGFVGLQTFNYEISGGGVA